MNGVVDEFGRALVTLSIRAAADVESIEMPTWVDTAFSGELVIPNRIIEAAKLEQAAVIDARLADGNAVLLESYTCLLDWFGETRDVEVIANDGEFPLLGVGLLLSRRLTVDYSDLSVTIA